MKTAFAIVQEDVYTGSLLLSSNCSEDEKNSIIISIKELAGRDCVGIRENAAMKDLHRICVTRACPISFKTNSIGLFNVHSHEIPHLTEFLDLKVITRIDLKKSLWSANDAEQLSAALCCCINITSVYLRQKPTHLKIA